MGMTEWHVRRVEDTQLPRYSPASVEISHEPVLRSSRWKTAGDHFGRSTVVEGRLRSAL